MRKIRLNIAIIAGGFSSSAPMERYLEIRELSGNSLVEAGIVPIGLISSIQHENIKFNIQASSQSFIQQKMQGKRRVY